MKKVKSIQVLKDEKTKTKWSKEKSMGNIIRTENCLRLLFAKSNPMVDKNHQWKMFLKDSDEQMGQQIKWKNGLGWLCESEIFERIKEEEEWSREIEKYEKHNNVKLMNEKRKKKGRKEKMK